MASFIGEALLDAMVNGRDQPRMGNRDASMAPHNVCPCAESGSWISVAVGRQEEWEALCKVVGHEEWLADPRYADASLRWSNQEALDGEMARWTERRSAHAAMEELQRAGVPATMSYSAMDLLADPHLHDREVFHAARDQDEAPYIMMGLPWKFSRTEPQVPTRPPRIGEHNHRVFQDMLGMRDAEVEELVRRGVIA